LHSDLHEIAECFFSAFNANFRAGTPRGFLSLKIKLRPLSSLFKQLFLLSASSFSVDSRDFHSTGVKLFVRYQPAMYQNAAKGDPKVNPHPESAEMDVKDLSEISK
jgi:hypothetical protein